MKHTASEEMSKLDMTQVIKEMSKYATKGMKNINVKKLGGSTSEDVVSNVLVKVLEGTRNWEEASTEDFETFLYGCLRSDIHNVRKSIRRANRDMFSFKEEIRVEEDDIEVPCIKYTTSPAKRETDYMPKGYNNYDDQKAYYTDNRV